MYPCMSLPTQHSSAGSMCLLVALFLSLSFPPYSLPWPSKADKT